MNERRGQVATEFMMYSTIFLFVVIAAFLMVNHIQATEISIRENAVARETGEGFVHVLTLAVKGGEGFTYNYTFPRALYSATGKVGIPYRVYFQPQDSNSIIMEWPGSYGNFSYAYSLPAYDYHFIADGDCIGVLDGTTQHYLESAECSRIFLSNEAGVLTISRG
ncbi:MAG: hypothetical protein ABII71_00410 [Candidatus Micrarchaeota archaeon]